MLATIAHSPEHAGEGGWGVGGGGGLQTILSRIECKGAGYHLLATGAHQGVPSTYSLDQANVFLRAHGHHVKLSQVHA